MTVTNSWLRCRRNYTSQNASLESNLKRHIQQQPPEAMASRNVFYLQTTMKYTPNLDSPYAGTTPQTATTCQAR